MGSAAVFFTPIFRSAFSPSRPPPEPLERPSPPHAFELSTEQGEWQDPRTALLVVPAIAPVMQLAGAREAVRRSR